MDPLEERGELVQEVAMVRCDLEDIPQFTLPEGFSFRNYRSGDEDKWVWIHELADRWNRVTRATFFENFGEDLPAMEDSCFFLLNSDNEIIGTATAWYDNEFCGEKWGRVHWVAIIPDYQGKGLSKPLLTKVLARLAKSHRRCYLTTSILRVPALCLYLSYGFRPFLSSAEDIRRWREAERSLGRSLLDSAVTLEDLKRNN